MYNSKLFRVLQSFYKNDWKKFRRHLLTEVDEGTELIQLYDYIFKYRSELNHKNLEIDRANKKLYRNKEKRNFQNLMSRIYLYSMDYITIEDLRHDERSFQLQKIKALKNRHLHDLAIKQTQTLENAINKGVSDIWDNLLMTQAYHHLKFSNYTLSKDQTKEYLYKLNDNWNAFKKTLDLYYLMDMTNDEIVFHFGSEERIERLKGNIESYEPSNILSDVITQIIDLRTTGSEESFNYLFDILKEAPEKLSFNVGAVATIFCIEHENTKLSGAYTDTHNLYLLYKIGLETGFILSEGKMEDLRFLMMVDLISQHEGMAESEKWINKHDDLLNEEYKEEIINSCRVRIALNEMAGERALELTNQFEIKHPRLINRFRNERLLAYLLTYSDDREFLDAQIANYEKYLKRGESKMSNSVSHRYKNWLKIIKMIIKGDDILNIESEFRDMQYVNQVSWLSKYIEMKKSQL